MKRRIFKPRILPNSVFDFFAGILISSILTSVTIFLPAIVVALLAKSILAGFVTFSAVYGLWLLFTVKRLELDHDGIHFIRVLGGPKTIRWADIESIDDVTPAEVVLRAWMIPPFPPREMTVSCSMSGHVRIRFRTDERGKDLEDTYFPPRELDEFRSLVETYSKRAIAADPMPVAPGPLTR